MKNLLFLITTLLCVNLFSQVKPSIIVGSSQEITDCRYSTNYLLNNNALFSTGEVIYLLNNKNLYKGDVNYIYKANPTDNLYYVDTNNLSVKKISVKVPANESDTIFKYSCKLGDNVYYIYSSYDKNSSHQKFFSVNLKNDVSHKITEFYSFESKSVNKAEKRLTVFEKLNSFEFAVSTDNNLFLSVFYSKNENSDKTYSIIHINVFDTNLKKIWGTDFKMPIPETKVNYFDKFIDTKGNVYLLIKVENDSKERKNEDIPYSYLEIIRVENQTGKVSEIVFDKEKNNYNKILMSDFKDGSVTFTGYGLINGSINFDKIKYLFIYKLNNKGELVSNKKYRIPLKIVNAYDNVKEKSDGGITKLKVKEVNIQNDNSLFIVGEQEFDNPLEGVTDASANYFDYGSLVYTKINADDSLFYIVKIPKLQSVKGEPIGTMSYKYFKYEDSHYLVFLDNDENKTPDLDKLPKRTPYNNKACLVAYKINDKTGKYERINLFTLNNINGKEYESVFPTKFIGLSNKSILFNAQMNDKYSTFIKINLP